MSVYAEGRVNAYNVNGQQYALPKGLDAVAVALNTALFDRYGVAVSYTHLAVYKRQP